MSDERFRMLCGLTLALVELKLKEVPHLAIDNFAADVLEKLIHAAKGAQE